MRGMTHWGLLSGTTFLQRLFFLLAFAVRKLKFDVSWLPVAIVTSLFCWFFFFFLLSFYYECASNPPGSLCYCEINIRILFTCFYRNWSFHCAVKRGRPGSVTWLTVNSLFYITERDFVVEISWGLLTICSPNMDYYFLILFLHNNLNTWVSLWTRAFSLIGV